jgi:hypothetical protein
VGRDCKADSAGSENGRCSQAPPDIHGVPSAYARRYVSGDTQVSHRITQRHARKLDQGKPVAYWQPATYSLIEIA